MNEYLEKPRCKLPPRENRKRLIAFSKSFENRKLNISCKRDRISPVMGILSPSSSFTQNIAIIKS